MNWRAAGRAAVAVAAAGATLTGAQAADWTRGGSLTGRVEQITNPTFAVPAAPADSRRALAATGDLTGRAEDWQAALNAHYTWNESNTPILALDEYGFGVNGTRNFERDTLGLAAFLRRESALTSIAATSGAAFALARRETRSIAPTWQHSLSERWTLNVDASAQAVAYDQLSAGLVNYNNKSASAGLVYAFTPRLDLRLSGSEQRFRTEPAATASDTTGLTAGFKYLLSDDWTLDASLGNSHIHSRFTANARVCPVVPVVFCETGLVPFVTVGTASEGTTSGRTWNVLASYVPGERTSLTLLSSRSVGPSGGGSLSVTENSGFIFAYRFTDRLSAHADGSLGSSAFVGAGGIGAVTRTQQVGASLSWQLDERWFLDAGARWRQSKLSTGLSPESDTFFISLRYEMQRQTLR